MAYPLYVKFDGTTYNLDLRTSIETTGEERLIDDIGTPEFLDIVQKVIEIPGHKYGEGIKLKTDGLNQREEQTLTLLVNKLTRIRNI